jgi:hypothetical protein
MSNNAEIEKVDYKVVLQKYINVVGEHEGVDFIKGILSDFSDQEVDALYDAAGKCRECGKYEGAGQYEECKCNKD